MSTFSRTTRTVLFGVLFAFSVLGFASSAKADALLPGDISTCGELSVFGTYNLTADVGDGGTCFTIPVSGVTLNGNGHKVNGTASTTETVLYQNIFIGGVSYNTQGHPTLYFKYVSQAWEDAQNWFKDKEATIPADNAPWVDGEDSIYLGYDLTLASGESAPAQLLIDGSLSGTQIGTNVTGGVILLTSTMREPSTGEPSQVMDF